MKENEVNEPVEKKSLIDRRFFLKASTTAVAGIAAVTAIPTITEKVSSETPPNVSKDTEQSTKQWKAGWMAF